jgi:hypothetical protein
MEVDMYRRTFILVLAVGLLCAATVWAAEYWTYDGSYLSTGKATSNWAGWLPNADASNYNQKSVFTSPGDDSMATLFDLTGSNSVALRPDGFSYSKDIDTWLDAPDRAFRYSTVENFTSDGLDLGQNSPPGYFGFNGDVMILNHLVGAEYFDIHSGIQTPAGGDSLGVNDDARLTDTREFNLGDFSVRDYPADPDEMTYLSVGKYVTIDFGGLVTAFRPGVPWTAGGSAYQGYAHEADILTRYVDGDGYTHYGYFVKAYTLAGLLVGDTFWDSGLKWNTWKGYVSTSTASTATEASGHSAIRNFLRYVMDIDSLVVQDLDGDGVFDASEDAVLFSLVDDKYIDKMASYDGAWTAAADFTGQYFNGDTVFLYKGGTVTTYLDAGAGIFMGESISTSNATIWGYRDGAFDIDGLDITYSVVPEPTTSILAAGAMLAIGAGVLRKKMR